MHGQARARSGFMKNGCPKSTNAYAYDRGEGQIVFSYERFQNLRVSISSQGNSWTQDAI